jgi:hypothetical protein
VVAVRHAAHAAGRRAMIRDEEVVPNTTVTIALSRSSGSGAS